ncbi:formate dehydrogenase accessory sulfurtransferase FdhD [Psychrobacter sp.]|uniref:formate dehydrogenase accessory sulfurtransferase FdhD n=1 Tax=Psychrobacter sp. TaxID=56811 RepID=UPI0025DBCCBC|nr:formate dehydrogenase accessory sulfurtransferase FdhD [Psychrobacter sp.]
MLIDPTQASYSDGVTHSNQEKKPSSQTIGNKIDKIDHTNHDELTLSRLHSAQKYCYPQLGPSQELSIEVSDVALAVEAAVAIVINGIHYAVMMASPAQLYELALGFLYSEGLIENSWELLDWEITPVKTAKDLTQFDQKGVNNDDIIGLAPLLLDYDAYMIELTLNQRCHQKILAQKRQLAGRTGCGMCGVIGLKQALPDLSPYAIRQDRLNQNRPSLDDLLTIKTLIEKTQSTHKLTGAVHAAATLYQGELQLFEDVGRHNALDKLIGWKLSRKIELDLVVMTSRLSIELVQKAIRCQLLWLVGMSAPTSTAVQVAQRHGLGLAGFLRENRATFYT